MKIKIAIYALFLFSFALFMRSSNMDTTQTSEQTAASISITKADANIIHTDEIKATKLDKEAEILASYLAKYNSPLQYHAQDFVDAAKKYELDWRLVASIAGVESTFGKFIPGGYNGWGWGVYGTQALGFKSWKDGIYTVSEGLKKDYISRGLLEPYAMNKRYASSPVWGSKVSFFMADLSKFAASYQTVENNVGKSQLDPNIAAVSGTLVLR